MSIDPRSAEDYRERVSSAVIEAIISNSITVASDGQRVAAILSAEIIDIMVMNIAIFAAPSDVCATPSKTRKFCDELARKIQRRIVEAKSQPSPFDRVEGGIVV